MANLTAELITRLREGDSPDVRRGQVFTHAPLRIELGVPDGFLLRNSPT